MAKLYLNNECYTKVRCGNEIFAVGSDGPITAPVCDWTESPEPYIHAYNYNPFTVKVYIAYDDGHDDYYYYGTISAGSDYWFEVDYFEEYYLVRFERGTAKSNATTAYSGEYGT